MRNCNETTPACPIPATPGAPARILVTSMRSGKSSSKKTNRCTKRRSQNRLTGGLACFRHPILAHIEFVFYRLRQILVCTDPGGYTPGGYPMHHFCCKTACRPTRRIVVPSGAAARPKINARKKAAPATRTEHLRRQDRRDSTIAAERRREARSLPDREHRQEQNPRQSECVPVPRRSIDSDLAEFHFAEPAQSTETERQREDPDNEVGRVQAGHNVKEVTGGCGPVVKRETLGSQLPPRDGLPGEKHQSQSQRRTHPGQGTAKRRPPQPQPLFQHVDFAVPCPGWVRRWLWD